MPIFEFVRYLYMKIEYDFEIKDLGHAKYFTFYMLSIDDGENYERVVIENNLTANTQLNEKKT